MSTRRPISPIAEKGVHVQQDKLSWWDRFDSNGDYSLAILQLVLAPIVLPYLMIKRYLGR